jgi:hypothetical protein
VLSEAGSVRTAASNEPRRRGGVAEGHPGIRRRPSQSGIEAVFYAFPFELEGNALPKGGGNRTGDELAKGVRK